MGRLTRKMTPRDKARWVSLLAGAALMGIGVFVPVPLNIMGKTVTNNAFLAVGAVGAVIALGFIQAVKAVKGNDQK